MSANFPGHTGTGGRADSGARKDQGRLHRMRHGVLSREVLAALVQLGEDPRTYRRLERQFRAALQPTPPWGNLFFDRFWACYLRLMLIGWLEAQLLTSEPGAKTVPALLPSLVPGEQPRLVLPSAEGQGSKTEAALTALPRDLLHKLVLAQRYDSHHAREMYRALALLLLLRRSGEAGLETWALEILGASRSPSEHGGANNA